MFKKILTALGAIVVTLIPVFVAYYLNQSKPDVRYTLSEGIPVSFLSTSTIPTESVQQLEVKNVGAAKAERIVVKIEGQITSYEIEKHIASDVVEIFNQQWPIEVIYPALPPQAGFKLIFKSPLGIRYNNLTITHSTGTAKEALLKTERQIGWTVLLGSVVGFWVFWISMQSKELWALRIDSWKREATRKSASHILSLQKPWYALETKWKALHTDAIKQKLEDERYTTKEIANSAAYQFLCAEKPEDLDDDNWNEIITLAIDLLDKRFSRMADGYPESEVMRLLRLERPKYFPQDRWDDLNKRANERFVSLRKGRLYDSEMALRTLKEEKPDEVSEVSWLELTKYFQEQYYNRLLHDLEVNDAPFDFLSKCDLSVLDEKMREELEQRASRKAKYEELVRLLESLLDDKEAIGTDKPSPLSHWEWEQLKRFEERAKKLNEVETRSKEIQLESSKLATERSKVSSLRQKIERQLDIINDLFNDPTTIDRIESYDDTFAAGNLENLRRVAQILAEANQ
jgi:hypothetical protein